MNRLGRLSLRGAAQALVLVALVAAAGPARAGGFDYGPQGLHAVGRGGAFVAKADDPSAIYWNPGKISLLRGTRVLYNHNFTDASISFQRAPATLSGGQTFDFAKESEALGFFPLGASFGVTTDFGLKDWAFGLAMQGPAAIGEQRFPYSDTAGTRYGFLSSEVLMAHVHLAAAWKYEEWFGLGVSVQYVALPYLKYSLVLDAPSGTRPEPHSDISDLRADLDMADWFSMTLTVGAWVRPLPYLEIGVSAKVVPISFDAEGDVQMSGTPNSLYGNAEPFKVPAMLRFNFPMTVQAGIRYFFEQGDREVFDVELGFAWEGWSVLDAFRVEFQVPQIDVFGTVIPLEKIVLPRKYQDTYSVKLGGQWNGWFEPVGLTVRLGGWWESGAHRNAYSLWDFPSFDRFGVATGVSVEWKGVEVGLSYAHVFQMDRTVAAGTGKIPQQIMQFDGSMAEGAAINEGTITSSYDILTIGVGIHFDALLE